MRIMIGTERRIDEMTAMTNYYTLDKNMNNKKNRKYCNTLMVVARIIIYTLYYKEDQRIRNNVIECESKKKYKIYSEF